jgi:uncharacterized protein (DUF305 family)
MPVPPRYPRRVALRRLSLVLVGLLALTACATEEQTASPESGEFSGPDVAFLRDMIPHHEEAVVMAELVPERTERQELVELAEDIVGSQTTEVEQMRDLLERSGADQPDADGDHGGHDDALTEEELGALSALEGTPFDLAFLDLMIAHHRSAVRDAQDVLDRGDNPEVRILAESIIAEQEAELERMERWRDEWGAEA